jgi:hypothetical protein
VDAKRERAKKIVEFWNRRGWIRGGAPLHVHPLDLDKLEELIARELARDEERAQVEDAV